MCVAAAPERRQDEHVNGDEDEFRVPSHKKKEVESKQDEEGCVLHHHRMLLSQESLRPDERDFEMRCMCNVACRVLAEV